MPLRERRPSMGAPIVDIQGSVSPAGISRPKHKRTFTGFGATEIKSVEGVLQASFYSIAPITPLTYRCSKQMGGVVATSEQLDGDRHPAIGLVFHHTPQKLTANMCVIQLRFPSLSE